MNRISNNIIRLRVGIDIMVVVAVLATLLLPFFVTFPSQVNLMTILSPPSLTHPLGTDNLGRDLLGRIIHAFHDTVWPLWGMVLITSLFGLLLGLITILINDQMKSDRILTIPYLLALAVTTIPVGIAALIWSVWLEHASLQTVVLALGVLFSLRIYLQVLDLYQQDRHLAYWQAHRSLGGSISYRLYRYGLQLSWRQSLVGIFTFHLQAAIVVESGLSYLGFGVQEPHPSFGNILASHYDAYLRGDWWVLIVIVAALALSAAFPACVARSFAACLSDKNLGRLPLERKP